MEFLFKHYHWNVKPEEIAVRIKALSKESATSENGKLLKKIFACLDLTSLNITDTTQKILEMCQKINHFHDYYPDIPNVAGVCVFPKYIHDLRRVLYAQHVKKIVVGAGFPYSQTFDDIKAEECRWAIEHGADEIDVVFPVGEFLQKNYQHAYNEISDLKRIVGDITLKVILETGVIDDLLEIKKAAVIAMEAGADFIKTSSGKTEKSATPEAVYVMAQAAKEFYDRKGKRIGIKAAGGIRTSREGLLYTLIVRDLLGEEWISPASFRIGASSLANHILSELLNGPDGKGTEYF